MSKNIENNTNKDIEDPEVQVELFDDFERWEPGHDGRPKSILYKKHLSILVDKKVIQEMDDKKIRYRLFK